MAIDRHKLKSAAEKLSRGEQLTAAEKKAHAQWERDTEAKWRERIYRDVPGKDVRRLLGGKTAKQVTDLAADTGLPIGGEKCDLFAVFGALESLAGRLRKAEESAAGSESDGSRLVKTQGDAIKGLSERGISVSIRTLRDWFSIKGCPGKSERGYDLDTIERWATLNSDKTSEDSEETRQRNRRRQEAIKEEELRIKRLKADDLQRADEAARGNVLPLDECIEMITSIVAIARTEIVAIPKLIAPIAADPELQRRLVTEGSLHVAKCLDGLSAKLARVPQQVKEGDE